MSRNNKGVLKPFWLIVKDEPRQFDVLTTKLTAGEKALPVFSFEEEARMFLDLGELGNDWRVRETASGELVSVLYGPCATIDRVVLDPIPLPGPLTGGLNGLLSRKRGTFIRSLLDTRRFRPSGSGRGGVPRTPLLHG